MKCTLYSAWGISDVFDASSGEETGEKLFEGKRATPVFIRHGNTEISS